MKFIIFLYILRIVIVLAFALRSWLEDNNNENDFFGNGSNYLGIGS
jgi:hypothetical protein